MCLALSFSVVVSPASAQEDSSLLASLFEQVRGLQGVIQSLQAQLSALITGASTVTPPPVAPVATSGEGSTPFGTQTDTSFRLGFSKVYNELNQTFNFSFGSTAQVEFTGASVALAGYGNPTFPVTLSIHEYPNGPVLASGIISGPVSNTTNNPTWKEVRFSTPVPMKSLAKYTLRLSVADEYLNSRSFYRWVVDRNAPFPNGTFFRKNVEMGTMDAVAKVYHRTTLSGPAIKVQYPNGGETLQIGSQQRISWGLSQFGSTDSIRVELWDAATNKLVGNICDFCPTGTTYGSFEWTVGTVTPIGGTPQQVAVDNKYFVRAAIVKASPRQVVAADDSDMPFTISDQPSTTPQITVLLSPNGGEVWEVGKTYSIKWKTSATYSPSMPVQIGLRDSRYSLALGSGEETIVNTTNTGEYNFTVPVTLGSLSQGKLGGQNVYTVAVYVRGGFDESNAPFSITSGTTF